MNLFFELFTNLIPLYLIIALGFFTGRYFGLDQKTLINLILYVCIPVVMFGFVANLDLKIEYALLPVITFGFSSIVGIAMLYLGRRVYPDARANLLAMCSSMGNVGYFGLPLVLLLFKDQPQWAGVYMFMLLGTVMYEGTIGYYIAARGKFTVRDSIIKVLQFPSVYAISAGLLYNFLDLPLSDLFTTYWTYFKGAYVILGMMIIGAALSPVKRLVIVPKFMTLVFLGKFVFWPLLAFIFIMADRTFLHTFDPQVLTLIMVLSLAPPAANIAAFATLFDISPEKAASTILLMTLAAIFYIPVILLVTHMH